MLRLSRGHKLIDIGVQIIKESSEIQDDAQLLLGALSIHDVMELLSNVE